MSNSTFAAAVDAINYLVDDDEESSESEEVSDISVAVSSNDSDEDSDYDDDDDDGDTEEPGTSRTRRPGVSGRLLWRTAGSVVSSGRALS